ncbi:MAG TPA: ABC transporter substrate-binding protein, partial [Candidatus Binatia bacterium]
MGWIEGKNIAIEYRFAEQKQERLPALAAELVRLKVDVIVVGGLPGVSAAKGATATIPVVMTSVGDPVGGGVVASLARPGGNVTGLSGLVTELNTKRLEILKDAIPNSRRVALLWSASPAGSRGLESQLKELRSAAVSLKLKLEEIETQRETNGLESAFQTAKQKQVGAMMTTGTPFFFRKGSRSSSLPANSACRLFTHRR